jgi:peptidyl-prolyl cis-trans isomerase D
MIRSRRCLTKSAMRCFVVPQRPGIAGPLPSEFGPALYRINAILAATETTFEEARETLKPELAADAARRARTIDRVLIATDDDRIAEA